VTAKSLLDIQKWTIFKLTESNRFKGN